MRATVQEKVVALVGERHPFWPQVAVPEQRIAAWFEIDILHFAADQGQPGLCLPLEVGEIEADILG